MDIACPSLPSNFQNILYHKEGLNCSCFYIFPGIIREEGWPIPDSAWCSPDGLGEGLHEVRVEEANGPGHWLMNPLIVLLPQVAHLPQQRFLPVHQVLRETKRNLGILISVFHILVIASCSLAPSQLLWSVWSSLHGGFRRGKSMPNHTAPSSPRMRNSDQTKQAQAKSHQMPGSPTGVSKLVG